MSIFSVKGYIRDKRCFNCVHMVCLKQEPITKESSYGEPKIFDLKWIHESPYSQRKFF